MPATVWLGGFFNPQSFLTAIMQQTARKNEWPLDKMCLLTDVTKKQKEDFTSAPREGAYVHGLFMEGARYRIRSYIFVVTFCITFGYETLIVKLRQMSYLNSFAINLFDN